MRTELCPSGLEKPRFLKRKLYGFWFLNVLLGVFGFQAFISFQFF